MKDMPDRIDPETRMRQVFGSRDAARARVPPWSAPEQLALTLGAQ